jgi:ABC transport system ATP-binding/permease protein
MLPGFGKQSITVGSAAGCDLVLSAHGVAPEHARIVHQGGGTLLFIPSAPGCSVQQGHGAPPRMLAPGEQVPFDFRTAFSVAQVTVPLNHPALLLMILATGQHAAPRGQLVIGRDPTRASLVIQHPSVSSLHATVALDRMMVTDHGSTSGTFVGANRTKIAPNQPVPVEPNGFVAFGPVPFPVSLLAQLAQSAAACSTGPAALCARELDGDRRSAGHGRIVPSSAASPVDAAAAERALTGPRQPLGRGSGCAGEEEQDDPRAPRVRRRREAGTHHRPHARQRHRRPASAGVEPSRAAPPDRRAALHRGPWERQRHLRPRPAHPAGQKIGIQSGEKIYIGPMPLQVELSASGLGRHRAGGLLRREVGRQAALRDRGLEPLPRGARSRQPGRDEGAARQRQLQGAAGRHDRADGPDRAPARRRSCSR